MTGAERALLLALARRAARNAGLLSEANTILRLIEAVEAEARVADHLHEAQP